MRNFISASWREGWGGRREIWKSAPLLSYCQVWDLLRFPHGYPPLVIQIGEVARKMSQFDLDLKQDRDVVKGEQEQQGEKITEIATVSNRGL